MPRHPLVLYSAARRWLPATPGYVVRITGEWYLAKFLASQRVKRDRALTDVHDI